MNNWFNSFATKIANITGRSYVFVSAVFIILVWAVSGPLMGFSDTWQLFINTLTTLITFLMVFIIQNSQNRSANAEQIKLDFILEILGVDDDDIRQLETFDDKRLEEILKEVQDKQRTASSGQETRSKSTRKKG